MQWEELFQKVRDCNSCSLRSTCTQTVFGVGSSSAPILLIGEAPGQAEDESGVPFVGRAGQELQAEIADAGFTNPEDFFVTNIVKCRPPKNRDPSATEIESCKPWFDAQVNYIAPTAILCVGRIAANTLLNTSHSMKELRTLSYEAKFKDIPVVSIYHTSYVLRGNKWARDANVRDLRKLKKKVAELNTKAYARLF